MNGVSVAVGVIALIGAALLAVFGNMQWPRLIVALVITGVAGILNGTLGPTIHTAVNVGDHAVSTAIGRFTGTAITGVVGLLVLGFVGFRVWHKQIDMRTLGAAAAVPATVALIPGMLGVIAVTVVGIVPWLVASVIGFTFGIG